MAILERVIRGLFKGQNNFLEAKFEVSWKLFRKDALEFLWIHFQIKICREDKQEFLIEFLRKHRKINMNKFLLCKRLIFIFGI